MPFWSIKYLQSRLSRMLPPISDQDGQTATKSDLKTHLLTGPKIEDFSIERDRGLGRQVDL